MASFADARRLHEGRSLVRHLREDGSGTLSVDLPAESLELVMKALERVAARLPADPERSLFASGADALVQMAKEVLTGGPQGSGSSDEHQVVVHVDAAALAGQGGESELPLPMVKRLCCDGAVVPVLERDRVPLNVGRKQRTVPTAIKRALVARDRTCTFPGCHHQRFLEAHHVHHWADGGETSLANLLLLCSTHHTLIHEGGFSVRRHPDGTIFFSRPDGRPVEAPSAEGGGEVREGRVGYRIITSSAEGSVRALGATVSAPGDGNRPKSNRSGKVTRPLP